jgi:hypothetical protein
MRHLARNLPLIIFLVLTVRITSAGQSPPLGAPKDGSAKSDIGKGTEKPTPRQNDKSGADQKVLTVNQSNPAPEQTHQQNPSGKSDNESLLVWFTGLLAFVGLLQVGALVWQVVVLNRTLHQMREGTQKQLRAYMLVARCQLVLEPPNNPEAQVIVKNFGQTPAHKIQQWIGISPGAYPRTSGLTSPKIYTPASENSIGPQETQMSTTRLKMPLPEQVIPILGTTKLTFYVYGEIEYTDVFGHRWNTKYQYVYGGPMEPLAGLTPEGRRIGRLTSDTEGNEAT